MILSIQAVWLGCDWWDRHTGYASILQATCLTNDALTYQVAGSSYSTTDRTINYDLSRNRFG